jgi:acetyltransferase
VNDQYQRSGLGTELLRRLLSFGCDEKIERVVAEILPENEGMRRICSKLGFNQRVIPGTRTIYAEISLDEAAGGVCSEDDE